MTLDFRMDRKCIFSQCDSTKKLLISLPNELRRHSRSTLVPEYLFKIDRNVEKLDAKRHEEYQRVVVKLL